MENSFYINIHTHSLETEANTISVYNYLLNEDCNPDTFYSCGIHPWYIETKNLPDQFNKLESLITDPKCIAIGECGLDKLKGAKPELQEEVFRQQIRLAEKNSKPLIIHCVKKYAEVIKCLTEEKFSGYFILHGYNANPENIKPFLKMTNALFSFGGALLQKDNNASNVFKSLPIERCFLETDDKDLSIKSIYICAADMIGITEDDLKKALITNYNRVFQHGTDRG